MTLARKLTEHYEKQEAKRKAETADRKARNMLGLMSRSVEVARGVYAGGTSGEVVAKECPVRSEPYRRLVAALPCIVCGIHGYSQAAHAPPTGKAIKEDDRGCFPLCCIHPAPVTGVLIDGCHREFDQMRMMPREQMGEQAQVWAAKTRATIRMAGTWPQGLPQWETEKA